VLCVVWTSPHCYHHKYNTHTSYRYGTTKRHGSVVVPWVQALTIIHPVTGAPMFWNTVNFIRSNDNFNVTGVLVLVPQPFDSRGCDRFPERTVTSIPNNNFTSIISPNLTVWFLIEAERCSLPRKVRFCQRFPANVQRCDGVVTAGRNDMRAGLTTNLPVFGYENERMCVRMCVCMYVCVCLCVCMKCMNLLL